MTKPELYVAKPHIIRPCEPMGAHGILDLKVYTMRSEGSEEIEPYHYAAAGVHVLRETAERRIDKRLGLGFLVVSRGVANACIWGGQFPSLLNQTIYEFDPKDPMPTFVRKNVEEVGTFCCWEIGVVAHEGAAWRRYLLSPRAEADRQTYLEDRFQGIVGRD